MHAPRSAELRADIQAMRAIAVAAVFAYHLFPARVPGGFTGVDVFFVISGFLITGNLVREAEANGTIDVWRFWGRRMRRLLPASLLVLAVCAVATVLFVPENLWGQFLAETIASALYVQNWLLAANSVDYLAAENTPSPVQHFWTLSAEEQFYVATPLLLLALLVVGRRMGVRRPLLLGGLLATLVASLALSIHLTQVDRAAAYFMTTTRAWEFCAGALLVFVPACRTRRIARLVVAAGLGAVVAAAFLLSGETPFPGIAAALPVLGAVALIWAGAREEGIWAWVARRRAVRYVGDVSYSIYIWHWPLIVLLPYVLGHGLGIGGKVAVVGVTLVLAGLSTRFVEDPIRFSPRLLGGQRRLRTIYASAAVGMGLVVTVSLAGIGIANVRVAEASTATAEIEGVLDATPIPAATGVPRPTAGPSQGGASASPSSTPGATDGPLGLADCLGAGYAVHGPAACDGILPPDTLVPAPLAAADDGSPRADCFSSVMTVDLHICTLGPADAPVRLVAVGDSHSNQLLRSYEWIAQRYGWRIDLTGHNGCHWTTVEQEKPTLDQVRVCEAWKDAFTAWLDAQDDVAAMLVTMARSRAAAVPAPGETSADAAVRGLLEAWAPQMERGVRIVAIRDNPSMADDVVACVISNAPDRTDRCGRDVDAALGHRDALVEAVAKASNARLVDLTPIYCPGDRCEAVIGGVVVYRDRDHVTATWARTLGPVLGSRIAEELP